MWFWIVRLVRRKKEKKAQSEGKPPPEKRGLRHKLKGDGGWSTADQGGVGQAPMATRPPGAK